MGFLKRIWIGLFVVALLHAQTESDSTQAGFEFTDQIRLPTTSVKHQGRTGTCWIFSTISFFESEVLRAGGDSLDLSEMYIARRTYPLKAESYVRLHGKANFEEGGLAHDVIRVMQKEGLVPESAYPGKYVEDEKHNHREMIEVLQGSLDAIVRNRAKTLSPVWPQVIEGILNVYFGELPETFLQNNESFSPKSFAHSLNLNPDDYLEFTSYTHHPFYESFVLEVPDNWSRGAFINIPLVEFMQVIQHALNKGYTLVWDGDVSEKEYFWKKGVALLPEKLWDDKTEDKQDSTGLAPESEIIVTPEIRQTYFNNYSSTDDHLMHLIGLANDQDGTRYYILKDSASEKENPFDGYVYISESYMRAKTVSIMVHHNGVPKKVKKEIGL
ncbi:aminopeptidase [candidate division KSB1 bacterium]|nr:aminopeptidase [candidate division KSB1 bacterium]